ncbi:SdiA-regulated [Steroidobacter agaridevorans]|uniref:SdiA-regulated n=1 Tax=Steroidobacter agaridevorans TaxID=2695856 RepID=A0A829YLR9_9GAMM|nr:SdiA-regulated domain-containing protein [Steroidobacter agaridevorans]GFE84255.1 SdiA-regulated [Steroidobacter agaridevorans]GFE87080.1 SdiA-regulated [Steroidobacter agaridevorans]
MKIRSLIATAVLLAPAIAGAQVASIDLGNYRLERTVGLPAGPASEASAVTWNWDSDSLFVVGDEGDAIVEVDRNGTLLSSMSLSGFDDTEGVTYIGGGRFVVVEERLQDAYVLTYTAGGAVARSSLASASLGVTVGNVGLEGISYDPSTGQYIVVKETTPQQVNAATLSFGAGTSGTANVTSLFNPAGLGLIDLSDVQVLSTVLDPSSPDYGNLLIYSQESARLLEVSRTGSVLSMYSLAGITTSAEGVTIDSNGVIYIVDEGPNMYVLAPAPVPLPAAAWLLLSGVAGLAGVSRRRK